MNMKLAFGAAVALAMSAGYASAQDSTVTVPVKKVTSGYAARTSAQSRTLTVAAPAQQAPGMTSPFGLITAPIGFAGNIVTAPLSGLSQAFGYGPIGGPARPLPIVARFADAGPVIATNDEGWAQPVPVTANGPVYKLEPVKNNGMISPFSLIAAPITAATTLATAPVNAVGGVLGAPVTPAVSPVF